MASRGHTTAARRLGETLLGKWTLERVLGVGGMAAVYAARHRNGTTAALKILHPELSHDDAIRERFLREGRVSNAVGHPGVVRVLDDDVAEDGSLLLVMELLEGRTAAAAARAAPDKRLPLAEVVRIGIDVLDVLALTHGAGILHRDIKPENIFLTDDGIVKVLDFGIARLDDKQGSLTRTGTAMGSPAYMAPEQALGKLKLLGPATDGWSVAAMMVKLGAGRFLREAESESEMLVRAATVPAPPIATLAPHFPPVLAEVLDRALAFDIADRFPDARSFQTELKKTLFHLPAHPESLPPPSASGRFSSPSLYPASPELSGSTLVAPPSWPPPSSSPAPFAPEHVEAFAASDPTSSFLPVPGAGVAAAPALAPKGASGSTPLVMVGLGVVLLLLLGAVVQAQLQAQREREQAAFAFEAPVPSASNASAHAGAASGSAGAAGVGGATSGEEEELEELYQQGYWRKPPPTAAPPGGGHRGPIRLKSAGGEAE
jgi:eukaryotic-like serine/threonine-protein kinase